jgi:hypothetical protein
MPYEETAKAHVRELCASVLEMRGSAVTAEIRSFLTDAAMGLIPSPLEPREYMTDLHYEFNFCVYARNILKDSSVFFGIEMSSLLMFYTAILDDYNSINPQPNEIT